MKKLFAAFILAFLTAQVFATFTAFPPQTSGTSTLDIAQAYLKGAVKYAPTSGCTWSTSATSYGNFTTQASCPAPTLSGEAVDLGDKRPAIKFSSLAAGRYVVRVMSTLYTTADSRHCYFRVTDGSNVSNAQAMYMHQQGGGMTFEFEYQTEQGETTFDVQAMADTSAGFTCSLIGDNFQGSGRGHEISVYYYPSEQKVFKTTVNGLDAVNAFSAYIKLPGGVPTVVTENVDWIDSLTDNGLGDTTVNFKPGLFEAAPSCVVTATLHATGFNIALHSAFPTTTSSARVVSANSAETATIDNEFTIICQRQGSDFKSFDDRFVPVVDPDFRFAKASTPDFTGTTLAKVELTSLDDKKGLINEALDRYEIDKTGLYKLSMQGFGAAGESNWFGMWYSVNGGATSIIESEGPTSVSGTHRGGEQYIRLNKGDYVELYINSGSTSPVGSIVSSLLFVPEERGVFIASADITNTNKTIGATNPVIYSAYVGTGGVVAKETGDWIDGDCTNAHPSVCTLKSGVFSSEPSCIVNPVGTGNVTCEVEAYSGTTSFSIRCFIASTAAAFTGTTQKTIICHGVQ